MRASTKRLVNAVRAEFKENRKHIEPMLDARPEPQLADPEYRNIQYAQNTLRTCMEAICEQLVPFSAMTPVELAIRMASYAISIAPLEDQDALVHLFVTNFADAHQMRIAQGTVIKTGWRMEDGRELDNHPEAKK